MDRRSNQNRDREQLMDDEVIGRAPAEDPENPDTDDSEQFEDDDFERDDEDTDE